MSEELYVTEGDTKKVFMSYLELLEWAVGRTYEISVNSPEEYDALTEDERERLDQTHAIWM